MNKEQILEFVLQTKEMQPQKTWNEIALEVEKQFGIKYDSTTLNKWWLKAMRETGSSAIEIIKQQESQARKEYRLLVQEKKNALLKREVHKIAWYTAKADLIGEAIAKNIPEKVKPFERVQKVCNVNKFVTDFIIADLQYKGNEEEWVQQIFNRFLDAVEVLTEGQELRLVFLGDDIEAQHAHPTGQAKENNTDTVTQTIELCKLYEQGINEIAKKVKEHFTNISISLVFVPYSNHGLIGGHGKERYQHPMEDMGRIIFAYLKKTIDKDIFIYEPNKDNFIVETEDTIYLHGHQGYVKSNRFYEVVGVDKDIIMGHLHHYEEKEERNRTVYFMPTCRKDLVDYERLAGFAPKPQIVILNRTDKEKLVCKLPLEEKNKKEELKPFF